MLAKNIRNIELIVGQVYEFRLGNPSHKKQDYIQGIVLKNYKNHILIEREGKIGDFRESINKFDLYCNYVVPRMI